MITHLSFLTWNVRGICNASKCNVVKELIRESRCAVVCIQETKWTSHSIFRLRNICNGTFQNASFTDAIGASGGTLTTWKSFITSSFSLPLLHTNTVILQTSSNFSFLLTNVYGPIDDSRRSDFFNELRLIRMISDLPWIILGDFNVLRSQDETTGGPRPLGPMTNFNDLIDELNLVEIPLQGRKYTFSNQQPNPTLSKLDRAFLSSDWNNGPLGQFYPVLIDLPKTTSDHSPLKLSFTRYSQNIPRPFHFERFWFNFSEVNDIVIAAWNLPNPPTNPTKRILTKFKILRAQLTSWERKKFKQKNTALVRSKWVVQLLDRVEERRSLNTIEINLRIRLKTHIYELASLAEAK
jgi:Endonuclease/Exonuclease/phosphatase family